MHFYTNVQAVGNSIFVREIKNKCRSKYKYKLKPELFTLTKDQDSEYTSIQGQPLSRIAFDSIKDAKEFIKQYKSTPNYPIFGYPRWQYLAIEELYSSTSDLGIDFDESCINIVYIDIETASGGSKGFPNINLANHEINAITVGFKNKTYTFGLEEVDIAEEDNTYSAFETEEKLLTSFVSFWKKIDPDIVTGWNVSGFDMPYIVGRIESVLGEDKVKELSPWGMVSRQEEATKHGKPRLVAEITGVAILDYLDLYRKFKLKTQESYKLDYISYVELGENKVDYSDYGSLHDLYSKDYARFISYNIHDVRLVQRLEKSLGYISLSLIISYLTKTNYEDVFHNIRLWDTIIALYLRRKNIIVPSSSPHSDSDGYEGAYVKPPIIGKYDWIVSFDLTSLYPSIIRSFNISPDADISEQTGETALSFVSGDVRFINANAIMDNPAIFDTLTPILKEKNLSMCANGTLYSRDKKSFLAELMGLFFAERKIAKKKMLSLEQEYEKSKTLDLKIQAQKYDAKQNALKIILNSAYGALGSVYFRHYCYGEATAITLTGQLVIQRISQQLNDYMSRITGIEKDRILMNDTDSAYVDFTDFVNTFLAGKSESDIVDAISTVCANQFQKQIGIAIEDLATKMNAFENHLDMKREAIGQAVIVAKKRYLMRVHDSEGVRYKTPKTKITGLEAIKTVVPEFCRVALKKTYEMIFVEGEDAIIDFIEATRKEFYELPIIDISEPKSVSDISKYADGRGGWGVKTPSHVKGSIVYNRLLDKHKLKHKYEAIKDGEKIKIIKLKTPNPVQCDVISYHTVLPPEFGLDKYIDVEGMFDKMYLDPIKRVLSVIGWKHDRSVNVEDFFA